MSSFQNISYFKGLNALRFFAAYLVLMHHAETIREKNELANFKWLSLFNNGSVAVTFFFVLSGFLITYLLLKEKQKTATISIKKFYLKRIFRIWPLYFLLVFIGLFLLPFAIEFLKIDYSIPYLFKEVWAYFLFFVPGLVTYFFGHHMLEPLWSIGVEEVFYLIWAPLFKWLKKNILPLLVSIIIFKIAFILVATLYFKNTAFEYLVTTFQFESMAIGGIGAYFVFYSGEKMLTKKIFLPIFRYFFLSILLLYITANKNISFIIWEIVFKTPIINTLILDALFLYLILIVVFFPLKQLNLENKVLKFLGEISYGIYMYHLVIIFVVTTFLKPYAHFFNNNLFSFIFYFVSSVLTILVSTFSKLMFENYFLKLKTKL